MRPTRSGKLRRRLLSAKRERKHDADVAEHRDRPYVHITGLPETAYERLVGRDAELKRLDEAWADRQDQHPLAHRRGRRGQVGAGQRMAQAHAGRQLSRRRGGARLVVLQPGHRRSARPRRTNSSTGRSTSSASSSRRPAPPPRARRSPRRWRSAACCSCSTASSRCSTASTRSTAN